MNQEHVGEDERKRELLRKVYNGLDLLEVRLDALTPWGKSKAVDLVLQLRRAVTAEFLDVGRGREVKGSAPQR